MIKPIPPKFKVMIAGIVLTAGGLSATRFPADKSEKLFTAHKTRAVSSSTQDSGVTLLRPPTTLSFNDAKPSEIIPPSQIPESVEQEALLDVTSAYSLNEEMLPDKRTEEEQPEEKKYIPFQGDKMYDFHADNSGFRQAGPSPPDIAPTSIRPDDPTVSAFHEQQTHSLPPLELVSLEKIDTIQPPAVVPIPVTTTSQRVFYPDSRRSSRPGGNVVTARASTQVLPKSGSNGYGRGH